MLYCALDSFALLADIADLNNGSGSSDQVIFLFPSDDSFSVDAVVLLRHGLLPFMGKLRCLPRDHLPREGF